MLSRLREQFSTTALILSIAAIVLALAGGAIAATGGLTAKQKKEVKAIAKSFQGTGPAGPAGANGTNGTNGAKGDQGLQGIQGNPGPPGTNGKTVLNGTAVPAAGVGTVGDFYIKTDTDEIYGPKAASGPNGGWGNPTGLKGTNGTFGSEPLPPGQSLSGVWSFGELATSVSAYVPISFQVPVEGGLDRAHVHFIDSAEEEVVLNEEGGLEGVTSSQCLGSAASPTAQPGNLCIYAKQQANFIAYTNPNNFFSVPGSITAAGAAAGTAGSAPVGAILETLPTGANSSGSGTWAVHAPTAP